MKKMLLLAMAASASMAVMAANLHAELQQGRINTVQAPAKALTVNGATVSAKKATVARSVNASVNALANDGTLSASYRHPNMLYWGIGFSDEYSLDCLGKGSDLAYLHGPAFTDLTFVNTSTGATGYTWSYMDPTSYETVTSNSTDLTLNYKWALVDCPSLTATDGTDNATYAAAAAANFGVQASMEFPDGMGYFYVTPDNIAMSAASYLGGFGPSVDQTSGSVIPSEGFGAVFPQPAAPYCISEIVVYGACNFPMGTELTADIYTIDEEEVLSEEPIASAYFVAEQDYANTAGAGQSSVFAVTFKVQIFDGILYQDGYVNIDSPIAILFTNFDADVVTFDPVAVCSESQDAPQYTVSFRNGEMHIGGNYFDMNYSGAADDGDLFITSLGVYTDATFGFLLADNDIVTIPNNGGNVTVPLTTCWAESSLYVAEDVDYTGTVADWLSYEFTADSEIIISGDALPAGVEGRSANLTIEGPGCEPLVLTVNQGTTGITAVTTSAAKVSVEGGNFVVTAPEAINAATVYNVAGQAVAASEIAGTTTIDGSSLAKGVYIVRFNDGSSVKVVK